MRVQRLLHEYYLCVIVKGDKERGKSVFDVGTLVVCEFSEKLWYQPFKIPLGSLWAKLRSGEDYRASIQFTLIE